MQRDSRIEGRSFSKCGPCLSAAHIRWKQLQELHGLRAVPFRNVARALAPRTVAVKHARASRIPMISAPAMEFKRIQDYAGATAMVIRCAAVQKNGVLARFWIVQTQQS
eukprot:2098865-Pyramimonas_sp.AAC.1